MLINFLESIFRKWIEKKDIKYFSNQNNNDYQVLIIRTIEYYNGWCDTRLEVEKIYLEMQLSETQSNLLEFHTTFYITIFSIAIAVYIGFLSKLSDLNTELYIGLLKMLFILLAFSLLTLIYGIRKTLIRKLLQKNLSIVNMMLEERKAIRSQNI